MAEPTKRPTDEQLRALASPVAEIPIARTRAVFQRQTLADELLELRTALHAAGIVNVGELAAAQTACCEVAKYWTLGNIGGNSAEAKKALGEMVSALGRLTTRASADKPNHSPKKE